MHGLRTSSVLILDDNAGDALQIQRSLALHGIGAILVLGGQDMQLPSEPITGVRVAVLDIHLGVAVGAEAEITHTRGVVNELIAPENGPYVAVVWTAKPQDFQDFETQLRDIGCPPVLTVKLDKSEVLQDDISDQDKARMILSAIGDAIASVPPLEFSNLWEQLISDAANDTVVALRLDATSQPANSRGMALLAALLTSEASRAAGNDQDATRALLAALNPVHFDKVEERSTRTAEALERAAGPIREVAQDGSVRLDPDERAQLNTAMIFDQQADGLSAGHIYTFEDIKSLQIGPALPDPAKVRESIVEKKHLQGKGDLPAIPEEDLPVVFLEVSATCDHRQGKIRAARLIAGVAITAERVDAAPSNSPVIRRGDRLREVEPLNLPARASLRGGRVILVWDALYPVSVSATSMSELQPIGRLREPVISDIRSRVAFHISRSGYASV